MDRTERFYKIEMLIRNRKPNDGYVSFAELMDELGVSRATLKRDLEYLRSRMDAPIVYDRFHNGYKFEADSRNPSQGTHSLPGVWFSEREIHALLTMHQLIQGLDEGGVLARHLQPLLEKLHGMLDATEADAKELMKRVKIISPARRAVTPRFFELVGNAVLARKRLELSYFTRSRQQESKREVSPQRLVHYRNTWYLDAWCHSSDGLRRFALDAVRGVDVLDQRAKDVALKTLEAELDRGYGVYGGTKVREATLVFSAEAAQWVSHEQWHPDQQGRWRDDGRYELRLPFTSEVELGMDILRHGPSVVVEGDSALRAHVARQTALAAAEYSKAT